jgi:plastocyanin
VRRHATVLILTVALAAAGCSKTPPAVTVQMVNYTYKPVHITIHVGDSVAFNNASNLTHNFSVLQGGNVAFDVKSGDRTTTNKLGRLKPGTYPFECRFHFTQGMVGVLTVEAGS